MPKLLSIALSTILVLSIAPRADAQWQEFGATIVEKGWEIFGGGFKAGGSVNFGVLGHEQYWSFCSSNGYRSYYNRDGVFLCSYDEYNAGNIQPRGDVISYDQVCNHYFGNNASYKWSDATCESRSY